MAPLRTLHIRTPQASASVQDPVRTAEFTHTHSEPAFPREFQEFLCVAVPGPDLIGITMGILIEGTGLAAEGPGNPITR